MFQKYLLAPLFVLIPLLSQAQTNIISTNPVAEQIMLGNYNPATWTPATIINHHDSIVNGINSRISTDSLLSYLEVLSTFHNRNTGADTVSNITGIGAARRWIYSKFEEFSLQAGSRLIPSYLQFNQTICSMTQHRNVFAVLPGLDTSNKDMIIIEAHFDSRCKGSCDIVCQAHGMEDNGSGTALVMELARIMSRYAFNHTLVFLATTGEEQGLYGANAFVQYVINKGIQVKAVLNNDIVGGIVCGKTSSPPSCPGFNHIDSTQVRLFSSGFFNSPHKQLSRYLKLQYQEELLPVVSVPMLLTVMSAEDRSGRGGDHIPFRQNGYPAMRFTSANEHGDASHGVGYDDRQHTSDDILGIDTNFDGKIDSFFVDFNYLARNGVINGVGAGLMAIGPRTPAFDLTGIYAGGPYKIAIQITQQTQYPAYRVAVRTTSNDFDTVFTMTGTLTDTFTVPASAVYYVSVASQDQMGIEGLFTGEKSLNVTGMNDPAGSAKGIELLQNKPNPFDETTTIAVLVSRNVTYKKAFIRISDLSGRELKRLNIELIPGINEVLFEHGYNKTGTYIYSLVIDGKPLMSKKMNFVN
jgi:hypothetical protein